MGEVEISASIGLAMVKESEGSIQFPTLRKFLFCAGKLNGGSMKAGGKNLASVVSYHCQGKSPRAFTSAMASS